MSTTTDTTPITARRMRRRDQRTLDAFNRQAKGEKAIRAGLRVRWSLIRYRAADAKVPVCAEWSSFDAFLAWALPQYARGLCIERIDPAQGFSPENCRWVGRAQVNRRARAKAAEFNRRWSEPRILAHTPSGLSRRGKPPQPVRCKELGKEFASINEAARACQITHQSILSALRTGGSAAGFHWEKIQ